MRWHVSADWKWTKKKNWIKWRNVRNVFCVRVAWAPRMYFTIHDAVLPISPWLLSAIFICFRSPHFRARNGITLELRIEWSGGLRTENKAISVHCSARRFVYRRRRLRRRWARVMFVCFFNTHQFTPFRRLRAQSRRRSVCGSGWKLRGRILVSSTTTEAVGMEEEEEDEATTIYCSKLHAIYYVTIL